MKNVIILALVGLIAGGLLGYKYGKQKARQELQDMILESKSTNGIWSFNVSNNPGFSDFILATQCVLGGNNEQSVLFTSTTDSEGNALQSGGNYKIVGSQIAANDWSLTAYNPDHLIDNLEGKFYVSKSMVTLSVQGTWEAYLTPSPQNGNNWIPSGTADGPLMLALRIYNARPEVTENLNTLSLPQIIKVN